MSGWVPTRSRRRVFAYALVVGAVGAISGVIASPLLTEAASPPWLAAIVGVASSVVLAAVGTRWALRPVRALIERHEAELTERPVPLSVQGRDIEGLIGRAYDRQRLRLEQRERELAEAVEAQRGALDRLSATLDVERERRRQTAVDLSANLDVRTGHLAYLVEELGRALAAASGATDLALDGDLSGPKRRLIETSKEALDGATRLLRHYRSNIDRPIESFSTTPRSFSLRRVVASTLRLLTVDAARRDVELVLRFGNDVPHRCLADADRLRQVLGAFVAFAVERARSVGRARSAAVYVNVSLDAASRSEDGLRRRLRFVVEGDGPPLSASERAQVFEAGGEQGAVGGGEHAEHGDLDAARPWRWSPLGIAQRLLVGVGGRAWVDESTASGTRLAFSLPVQRQKRVTVTTLYGRGAITDKAALVVDGVAHSRALISELLSSWRLLPTAVSDAEQALAALRSAARSGQPFDLLVIDRRLADTDDVHLLDHVARDSQLAARGVLLLEHLDTIASPVSKLAQATVGATALKPILPAALLEAVTSVLAPPRVAPEVAPRPASASASASDARPVRVLVADDNTINQVFAARVLERRGLQVTVAGSGAEVIDLLEGAQEPFDVILMDIQMPVLDGTEATAIIREREQREGLPRVPIIAVTAHAMGGERQRCLDAGMDGYIPKPIVEDVLFAEIEAHLPSDRQRRPSLPEATADSQTPRAEEEPEGVVFDEQQVLDFVAGDSEFLANLVELFADTAPKQLAGIGAAIERGDAETLNRAAHQLKGSVGNFTAERAWRWAYELEKLGQAGRVADARVAFDHLSVEIERLKTALEEMAARHGAGLSRGGD